MTSLYRYRRCILNQICRYRKRERVAAYSQQISVSSQDDPTITQQVVHDLEQTTHKSSKSGSGDSSQEELIIPKRIHRSPTDILDALAATVKRDPYGPRHMYMDDPELLPTYLGEKKDFALAMVSGRKAAQYVLKKWPKFIAQNPMDPTVEIPDPYQPYKQSEHAENSMEYLEEMLDLHSPEEAYKSYRLMKDAGESVPEALQLDLLDLLCVYNSSNEEILHLEERWLARTLAQGGDKKVLQNVWSKESPAETLFGEISDPPCRAYSSMVKGKTKFGAIRSAVEMYKEMCSKGFQLDIPTYCAALKASSMSQVDMQSKIQVIMEIMTKIKNDGLEPTVGLFAAAFESLFYGKLSQQRSCMKFCAILLGEMYTCGLEPTPGIWYRLITIVYRQNGCKNAFLTEVVKRLDGKSLVAEHPDDLEFFAEAMLKARKNLNDLHVAYKLDNLLNFDNNYQMAGGEFVESLYYQSFFKLLCTFEDVETIMEYYRKSVPNWCVPTLLTIINMCEAMELNENYKYLPELWSDMFRFHYERFSDTMRKLARLAAKPNHKPEIQTQLHAGVLRLYEEMKFLVMMSEERGHIIERMRHVNAPLLCEMWQVCLNSNDINTAKEMFGFYKDYKANIEQKPLVKPLENLADIYLAEKDFNNCVEILTLMETFAYNESDRLVKKMKSGMELSPDQLEIIKDIIGG